MKQFKVQFQVNVVHPKSKTLSISRKTGTSDFLSNRPLVELCRRYDEVSEQIAIDLTSHGFVLFSSPEIISITEADN